MERLINKLKTIFILCLVFSCVVFFNTDYVQAREIGQGNVNNYLEGEDSKYKLKDFPKVWTGDYDGSHGDIPVNRKYALKIKSIDEDTGKFTGLSYVDKGTDKPNYQAKAVFNVSGKIDVKNNSIEWARGSAVDNPNGLTYVEFKAFFSKDLGSIKGSTSSYKNAKVNLKSALTSTDIDKFNYNENKENYDLANECMELSLLVYGNAAADGNGYYTEAKKTTAASLALKRKLESEGFPKELYVKKNGKLNLRKSAKESENSKDCIHWVTAKKKLEDGTTLVYIIVKGTTGNEWYGNFNVYDEELKEQNKDIHYSFQTSAEALYDDVNTLYKGEKKIKYVVTGHSRGAAVANILAKKLTDEKESNTDIDAVYGYTFATPTTIAKSKCGNYTNIYNYCFDDDFVTYMPLADADWQYGRYGKTFCAMAAKLNKKYKLFQNITKNYFMNKQNSLMSVSYKENGAYRIAKALTSYCSSVDEFYAEKNYVNTKNGFDASWYEYFSYIFVPLMGGKLEKWSISTVLYNKDFFDITSKFVVGAIGYNRAPALQAYVGNTHDPGSYYALTQLLEYNSSAIDELSDISKSSIRNKLAKQFLASDTKTVNSNANREKTSVLKVDYDVQEVAALQKFANQGNNLSLLGWDLQDPSTWSQVSWNANGKAEMFDFDSMQLTGKLDLSVCSDLQLLECTNNKLTELILPDKDCVDVYCEGNYLSVDKTGDLYKQLAKYSANNSIVSFENQCISDEVKFDTEELKKLKNIANTGDNLDKLGWTVDDPKTYSGIEWVLSDETYHVEKIDLTDMELTGKVDFSDFVYLESVNLASNQLEELTVSNCQNLITLNVCNNKLVKLDITKLSNIKTLLCSNNYLVDNLSQDILALTEQDNETVAEIYPQFTEASSELFDENELLGLKTIIGNSIDDIDWEHPGANTYFQWIKSDGKYYLQNLNLNDTDVSGDIDLTNFAKLTKVSFARTKVRSIKLPSSTTESEDYAFAYCPELVSVEVTDSWTSMGTNVFYASPNVTITCTRDTFAQFIASALDIPFKEVIKLSYLEVGKKPQKPYLKGQKFDLNGGTLLLYYSDGTQKEIEEGFTVTGYDADKLGKQTVELHYTEDNYTKSTKMDIVVYGHAEKDLLYLFTSQNQINICGYIGKNSDVEIPSEIDGVPVVKIEGKAFEDNQVITNISIPDSVKEMGNYVFSNCKELCSIEMPTTITRITEGTFYNCEKLFNLKIHGDLQYIDKYAFEGCKSMKTFDFGNSLKEIGYQAFRNCKSLEEAIMPDTITGLGGYIFESCISLKKVHINEGRVNIMQGLFDGCVNLQEINIPDTVVNICENAFYGCEKLSAIKLPNSLKVIEERAFYKCSNLQDVELPSNLSKIENSAFAYCAQIKEIVLPDSITSLGEFVFYNCKSLRKVKLNEGRISIASNLFDNCQSLVEVKIPDSVQYIRSYAFRKCASLDTLVLPAELKEIESRAFEDAKIKTIEFSGTVEQLKKIKISKTGNSAILNGTIKTLADGKTIVLVPDEKQDKKDITVSKTDTAKRKNENNTYNINGITAPSKVKLTSAKNGKGKKLTVKWKKVTGAKGYQLQYALNKKFKKKKIVQTKKTKSTIKKLKKKKTYYIRVRAYKMNGRKKVYGKWSTVKKVKIKK